jgi:hypothetical protein
MNNETVAAIVEITDVLALLGMPYDALLEVMTTAGYGSTAGLIETATEIYHM